MRFLAAVALVAILLAMPGAAGAQSFGYLGDLGPSHWGALSPDWATCGTGTEQSPVDFRRPPLRSHPPSIAYGSSTGAIFNNGHTIEVEVEGQNTLTVGGVAYALVQFHFHTPSEHRVKGRGYDMELHLVHKSAAGGLAVLGVFMTRGPSSGALAPIFAEQPNDLNVHHELEAPFDPATFLPRSRAHFRYAGSLTTPPCTEGVEWVVLAEPVSVS